MNLLGFLTKFPFLNRLSLRTKIVSSFLFVVIVGGLLSSLIGTKLVADTIILQAHDKVKSDLSTAWLVYDQSLVHIRNVVQLTASGTAVLDDLENGRWRKLEDFFVKRRKEFGLDILTLTDSRGKVLLRTHSPFRLGDDQSSDPLVAKALKGDPVAATAIVTYEELQKEGSHLAERAFIRIVARPQAKGNREDRETSGMMLKAAVPIRDVSGRILGVLYGGTLLNHNYQIVDKVRGLLYGERRYKGKEMGTATIFLGGIRISTNVLNEKGERAVGTRVSEEVYDAVIRKGQRWVDRAFVVKDWHITAYEPIRDLGGKIVGILYVGILEAPYIDLRHKVIYSFFGIGILGVLLVLILSFFITTGITRPLREMVWATRKIAEGDFSLELPISSRDEIGQLAESFNHMLIRLKQARQELEDYGRTLEEKVEYRSQELQKVQVQLMQSEKLAFLGRLASGVAHEINSPLTGILTFSHLLMRKVKNHPELKNELELIIHETTRVSTIVRGLLDFARENKPQKRLCNVNELILHTLSLVEHQSVFQNIQILKNLEGQIPLILLDPSQMQQVFMNILLNAADAMPAGGSLTISTALAPGDLFLQVNFVDTGCGIPKEIIHRIFDPFFTTKTNRKGTGLGLAVSYGIVERHRGRIEVQSEEGKGTTFTIQLPLQATEDVPSL